MSHPLAELSGGADRGVPVAASSEAGSAGAQALSRMARHLGGLYGAMNLGAFYEALVASCRDLAGSSRVSVLAFQRQSRRARLRFTTHPDLAASVNQLMPFDGGALSAALRAGLPADAAPESPLMWSTFGGATVVSAAAARPLAFEGDPYGAILFHDLGPPPATADVGPSVWLDLIAQAAGVAFVKCEMEDDRSRQVVDSRVRLAAITRMGRVLNSLDLEVLLQRIMDVALSAVNGQVGSIVLARDGRLETVVEWGLDHSVVQSIHYPSGRTVIEEVYHTKLPILLVDPATSGRVGVDRHDVRIDSYLCIPLGTSRGALGVLNIINSASGQSFSDRDIDLLLTIGNLASAALENALLHQEAMAKERIETQLGIASGIQKSLLPEAAPTIPGFDIAGWNHPCEAVGGDYFDFVTLDDGRVATVIGDVSGHGIGPALLMSSCHAALRSLIACQTRPDEIITHLNRLLTGQILSPGTFITMIFAVVNTAERSLVFTNAGHPPPLVFNAAGLSIREPAERGLVLGVDPEAEYPSAPPTPLASGDVVAFYTDGVLDAEDRTGNRFGKGRLTRALVAHRHLKASDLLQALRAEITAFCGDRPPHDDLTLVLLKAL